MRTGTCWSRPICLRIICPRSFVIACASMDLTSRFVSLTASRFSDADKLRPIKKQEDYGFTFAGSKSWRETFADALAAKFDAASNVRDMEREGVDVSVLFRTLGLYIMWRSNLDPELSAAICRA